MNYVFVKFFSVVFALVYSRCSWIYAHPTGFKPCKEDLFPCNNSNCVDQNYWCDMEDDCGDSTDEIYCRLVNTTDNETFACPPKYFQCADNSLCIPEIGRCNGYKSCDDNSDELNCYNKSLPSTTSKEDMTVLFVTVGYGHQDTKPKKLFARLEDEQPKTISPPILKSDNAINDETIKVIRHRSIPSSSRSGFTELRSEHFSHQRGKAADFLVSQRKEDYGWGDETPRALMALIWSNASSNYETLDVYMLMVKQLDVMISIDLARNETKPIKLTDIALYINAIMSTCRNPRNFNGYDLVSILRNRVDAQNAEKPDHFVSPSVYLTLCINKLTTELDYIKLMELAYNESIHTEKLGVQALALLATICVAKTLKFSNLDLKDMLIQKLLQKIKFEGLPRNVHELSLLIQALNEARVNELEWQRAEAVSYLLKRQTSGGSFGDLLATYYVLPIISGRSLLSLDDHCAHFNESDMIPAEVPENTKLVKIDVKYSLYHGDPVDLSLTMRLHITKGTNFIDIMRMGQDQCQNYRFKVDGRRQNPLVYSIGGIPNDAEKGMFWTLYLVSNHSRSSSEAKSMVPYHGNIKTLIPEEEDEIVFWWKSI